MPIDTDPNLLTEALSWPGLIYDGTGSTYGGSPPAFLCATPKELVLRGSRGEFCIPAAAVWKITLGEFRPWLFNALRIHHHILAYPNELQFKPERVTPHAVLAALRSLGYLVL